MSNNNLDFMLLMEDYYQSYSETYNLIKNNNYSYRQMTDILFSKQIYYGNSYINAFKDHGYSVEQVLPHSEPIQSKWAEENGLQHLNFSLDKKIRWLWMKLRYRNTLQLKLEEIVTEQIQLYRPKVLWIFSGVAVTSQNLDKWRKYVGKIVLWWSCNIKNNYPYKGFDLILTCIPHLVEYFNNNNIKTEFVPHAFNPDILKSVRESSNKINKVVFAGALSGGHAERIHFLDKLSEKIDIDFYGKGVEFLPEFSHLRRNYLGEVWGKDLYSIFAKYLITIHLNIGIAGTSFSAKRLFEAGGMGSCVITEHPEGKQNTFEIGHEIITFKDFNDCVNKIKYYLETPKEAIRIGLNAQKRVVKDHNYHIRVGHIINLMRTKNIIN